MRLHAYHSERILAGSDRLARLAPVVGGHHERLDGHGYHRGCTGTQLATPTRVLAVADAYQAMTQRRPHRPALAPEEAAQQLLDDVRAGRCDADAVDAVLAVAGHRASVPRPPAPAGLTDRETEVLGLIAGGCSNARIAAQLGISRRTAEHPVQHIYARSAPPAARPRPSGRGVGAGSRPPEPTNGWSTLVRAQREAARDGGASAARLDGEWPASPR